MTVKDIRLLGDPILRTAAQPVTTFDKELRKLVKDLRDTMLAAPGVGLAAPQIGVSLRVFAYDVGEDASGHLINPVLDLGEEEQEGDEGCLSIPGLSFPLRRRNSVIAKGFDEHGEPVEIRGDELLARCLQHETDHLDGVLFIDLLDDQTRKVAMKAIRDADWNGVVKPSPHAMYGKAL